MRPFALIAVLVACGNGGGKPAAPTPPPDAAPDAAPTSAEIFAEVSAQLSATVEHMCACTNDECRATVQREQAVWEQHHRSFASWSPTEAQDHAITEIMGRLMVCASGAQ